MSYETDIREPLIIGNKTLHDISEDIAKPIETSSNKWWWSLFGVSVLAMLWGFGCIFYTIGTGVGVCHCPCFDCKGFCCPASENKRSPPVNSDGSDSSNVMDILRIGFLPS